MIIFFPEEYVLIIKTTLSFNYLPFNEGETLSHVLLN